MSSNLKTQSVLAKLQYCESYLKRYSKEDIKDADTIDFAGISNRELRRLERGEDISADPEDFKAALDALYKLMDVDETSSLSNAELKKFEGLFSEVGLSVGNLVELFGENGNEVDDEINKIDASVLANLDLDGFKETIAQYPKLNEIVQSVGYEEFFNMIDTGSDGTFDVEDIDAVSVEDETSDSVEGEETADSAPAKYISDNEILNLLSDNGYDISSFVYENDDSNSTTASSSNSNKSWLDRAKEAGSSFLNSAADKLESVTSNSPSFIQNAASAAANTMRSAAAGGNYSNYSASPSARSSASNYSSYSNASAVENTDAMSRTELEAQKREKETELDGFNTSLEEVLNDSGEMESLKNNVDELDKTYRELLDENAENDPAVKALKDELEQTETSIKDNDDKIALTEVDLNSTQQEIASVNNEISGLENEQSALESSKASLESSKTDENKSEVEAKIREINNQLASVKKELQDAKDKLSDLQDKESELQDTLDGLKEEQENLKEQRAELEDNIAQTADEKTSQALKAYTQARDDYEKQKADKVDSIKNDISTTQTAIKEIEEKLQELDSKEIEKDYSLSPLAQYNEERGNALAQAALSLYGGTTRAGGYCATGVSRAINKAFGYSTSGNGCDYANVLSNRDDWVEVTDCYSAEDLVNLPAGAVVSWSAYRHRAGDWNPYGHVYISDGKGHEISDFTGNIGMGYANQGATFRVFVPV